MTYHFFLARDAIDLSGLSAAVETPFTTLMGNAGVDLIVWDSLYTVLYIDYCVIAIH